jgi:hypothetical protein
MFVKRQEDPFSRAVRLETLDDIAASLGIWRFFLDFSSVSFSSFFCCCTFPFSPFPFVFSLL